MFSIFFTGWCRLQPAYNAIHFSFIFNMFFHILLLPCSWYYYFFMGEFLLYSFFLELYLCMWMQCRKNCTHKYMRKRHMKIHTFFIFWINEREREKRKLLWIIFIFLFFGPSFSRSCTHLLACVTNIILVYPKKIYAATLHFTKCKIELWCIEVN